ncbi:MAG: enoyl-CoA hydratase/isomerase family protein [Ilumatobacter sp.]
MSDLLVNVDNAVATLTLNRPEKRNAVTYDMWLAIAQHCAAFAADDSVRLLVVAGEGGHFCAGADVAGMANVSAADYAGANLAADVALTSFPKPSIAAISGSCVGGGAQIATACDIRIADTTSRFGITPARLGILYPAPAIARTVGMIGPSATKHLLYSAEIVDADRALRVGLVDELLAPAAAAERLEELSLLLASQRSLLTQMASKQMVDEAAEHGSISDATVAYWDHAAADSPDAREGIAAFIEKRPPRFTWTPNP